MANLTVIIPVYNEELEADFVAAKLPVYTAEGIGSEMFHMDKIILEITH